MYYIHTKTIEQLIETYKQEQPLSFFTKSFFRANKKFGSRDRKVVTQNVFNFYRLGNALRDLDFAARLAVANYLVDGELTATIATAAATLDERLAVIKNIYPAFLLEDVFSFGNELSDGINKDAYAKSILQRPKVFIRIKTGFTDEVETELHTLSFQFEKITDDSFSFTNESKLTETESFKKGLFEIQDLSSQHTGYFFEANTGEQWWDCCAGAGGKSLLFKDKFTEVNLLLSDRRATILKNADARLKKANAINYKIENIDLNFNDSLVEDADSEVIVNRKPSAISLFDGIILDAPCSGSGTWARAPEALTFFKPEMIDDFHINQITIAKNAIQYLKPDGKLVYITCSAFQKENEEVVKQLIESTDLKLIKSELIVGYEKHADTMFVALFHLKG